MVKGAAASSRLDRPPALLPGEATIARQLAKNPDDPRWLQARGLAELLDRDFDPAIADFQRYLARQLSSPHLVVDMACTHFARAETSNSQPDYQTALDFRSRAPKISPGDPGALFNRAIVYQKMHLYRPAIADWQHYLQVDSNSSVDSRSKEAPR